MFNVPKMSSVILLDALKTLPNWQIVCVKIKVLKRGEPIEIKPGLTKQDYTIADTSGTAELILWQEDVDKLNVNESYEVGHLMVKSFEGKKYLTPPKTAPQWTFKRCDDIEIIDESVIEESVREDKKVMNNAFVCGVKTIEMTVSCLSCKQCFISPYAKVIKCTKCSTSQRLDRCYRYVPMMEILLLFMRLYQ